MLCVALSQATFFITYVLTLGWASLSSEVLQTFSLSYNWMRKYIFRLKDDPNAVPSFPYHTEVPKVLLFGLIGFTCSILAPLIVPFLLVYFFLGYLVYRNQVSPFMLYGTTVEAMFSSISVLNMSTTAPQNFHCCWLCRQLDGHNASNAYCLYIVYISFMPIR